MKILGIETSCDETGIALLEATKMGEKFEFAVHKHALLSQALLHSPYGGVYPNLAKREHQKNLPVLFEQFRDDDFDAIAVTIGPGLEPALWTGIVFAEQLAKELHKPLYAINHMEGHLVSSLTQNNVLERVQLPVLALLVSGGHTEFILMKSWFEYELVGQTLDDAVGEAFDKVARMLALPYPGGPEISKRAIMHRLQEESSQKVPRISPLASKLPAGKAGPEHFLKDSSFRLPRPMINENSCDVSFSGLKTAALYALRDMGGIQTLSSEQINAFASEFEEAVRDVLVAKTRRALQETGAATFVLGGGVAANTFLRSEITKMITQEFPEVEVRLPELSITGDNAIMIAEAALLRALSGTISPTTDPLVARGNLSLSTAV